MPAKYWKSRSLRYHMLSGQGLNLQRVFRLMFLFNSYGHAPNLLECLAVITFIGGEDPEETHRSMQIMWQVVHPKLGTNVVASKPSPAVITAMVSAWSFLLTTADSLSLSFNDWQESISYLSTLLDKDDRSVRMAAGEALAVIFEVGEFERFAGEEGDSSDTAREGYLHLKGLKGKVLKQVRDLASEAGGKGAAKKDLNSQRNLFRDLLDFLEDGYSPETSMKIGGESLTTSSWSQLMQLNFLKHFLQGGFVKHMQENEFLHDLLGFTPKKKMNFGNEDHSFNKHGVKDRRTGHYAVGCEEEYYEAVLVYVYSSYDAGESGGDGGDPFGVMSWSAEAKVFCIRAAEST
ncbi:hypothetical protein Cgig2_001080 [Carnegiea gigantea]|uniref:Interferon-related developmental regulator N-terminal domain-containing protein n=1 Tax=Carnegiea gigantea TaxID=171969 RepID=A0A9Q1K7E2_9CARY|nr:hypothetical protein Cgig2_001080 [Carnegiea gigantea]